MTLKVSISGVRGIYGETLTDDIIKKFGIAFSRFISGGTVIVGSDTRSHSPQVKDALFRGLKAFGKVKIIDVGYLPTPSVQVIAKTYGADGGIIITASHNPKQWNGIKFVRPDGIFLTDEEAQRLIALYEAVTSDDLLKTREGRLDIETDFDAAKVHLDKIKAVIDIEKIRQAKLKVVIDTCCGAGAIITRSLLDMLGVEYAQINGEPRIEACDRELEPVAAHLGGLGKKVIEFGAAIGFAQDPDGDRLAIVDEKGNAIGEDYTLCFAADYLLGLRAQGKWGGENIVCTNLSTTRTVDDVAKKHGANVIRTRIGEMNVSMAIKREKACTGGEGNGGIITPSVGFGRDSLTGIALILQYLAESKLTVSQLKAQYPAYVMYKSKIDCTSEQQVKDILAKTKVQFATETIDEQDGIKVIFKDGNWVHVRSSNTEPIIRIIAEAETLEKAKALAALI